MEKARALRDARKRSLEEPTEARENRLTTNQRSQLTALVDEDAVRRSRLGRKRANGAVNMENTVEKALAARENRLTTNQRSQLTALVDEDTVRRSRLGRKRANGSVEEARDNALAIPMRRHSHDKFVSTTRKVKHLPTMSDSDSFFGPTSTDAELLRALTLARKQHAHMSGPFSDYAPRGQFDAAIKEMLALEAEAQSRGVRKNPTARERAALEMLLAEHEGRVAKRNYAAKKPAAKKPAAKKSAAKKPAAKKRAAKK